MGHVSEYRGWVIAVTPREEAPALWRAVVSFARSAVSQDEILKAAKLHIEEWISIARADHEEENQ